MALFSIFQSISGTFHVLATGSIMTNIKIQQQNNNQPPIPIFRRFDHQKFSEKFFFFRRRIQIMETPVAKGPQPQNAEVS